jgi:hypothetical protein
MFRSSLAANSAYAFVFAGLSTVNFELRSADGLASVSVASTGSAVPLWLKLKRVGNVFTTWYSSNGLGWTPLGTANLTLPTTIKAGLAVSANNNTALNTASFDNVLVTTIPSAQPKLAALSATDGTHVSLSWPAWAPALQLYSATNLSPPAVWSPVTNIPVSDGTNWTLSLPNIGTNQFFRLHE